MDWSGSEKQVSEPVSITQDIGSFCLHLRVSPDPQLSSMDSFGIESSEMFPLRIIRILICFCGNLSKTWFFLSVGLMMSCDHCLEVFDILTKFFHYISNFIIISSLWSTNCSKDIHYVSRFWRLPYATQPCHATKFSSLRWGQLKQHCRQSSFIFLESIHKCPRLSAQCWVEIIDNLNPGSRLCPCLPESEFGRRPTQNKLSQISARHWNRMTFMLFSLAVSHPGSSSFCLHCICLRPEPELIVFWTLFQWFFQFLENRTLLFGWVDSYAQCNFCKCLDPGDTLDCSLIHLVWWQWYWFVTVGRSRNTTCSSTPRCSHPLLRHQPTSDSGQMLVKVRMTRILCGIDR